MNTDNARELALALGDTMPTDPVRKAQWIHIVHCTREMLRAELPLLDPDRWEELCYLNPDNEV